jgi:hypothetical protein
MSVIRQSSGSVQISEASGLDEIFWSAYEMDKQPGEVRADDDLFFAQDETGFLWVQYAESMGPGNFRKHAEDEEVDDATVRIGNRTVAEVFEYDRDIAIPQRYQEASSMYGTVQGWVRELGIRGRTSRDKWAMEQSYGDAFSGVVTPDGAALISNSHTALSGDTVDNLETGALSADNLFTVVKSLRLQKAQDGDLGSCHADGLLVPVNLHATATEVTASELKSGTANNNLNYFSRIYPGMVVGASEYLDSSYNALNSNANTSYFVVSRMHKITRTVRVPISTEYIEPKFDRKRRGFYRARLSERVYAGSWTGIVGSNGTA